MPCTASGSIAFAYEARGCSSQPIRDRDISRLGKISGGTKISSSSPHQNISRSRTCGLIMPLASRPPIIARHFLAASLPLASPSHSSLAQMAYAPRPIRAEPTSTSTSTSTSLRSHSLNTSTSAHEALLHRSSPSLPHQASERNQGADVDNDNDDDGLVRWPSVPRNAPPRADRSHGTKVYMALVYNRSRYAAVCSKSHTIVRASHDSIATAWASRISTPPPLSSCM